MTPERYARIGELYHQMLARPAEQRAACLAEACGDDEALRNEVASLLAAHDGAASFIETPAMTALAAGLAADHRPIAPGVRIGPYEVRALLGRGGMGEVYRAHDSRLGRDVALKVLPERFALDAPRLARFEREARLLAALNHPNIGALYGVEESQGRWVLVLELVAGPALAERLDGGSLPMHEALAIALQILEALDAAHEHGIVHRDLKPANINIRPDGTVKVLDFGLAKALDPASGTEPTVDVEAFTDDHTVVGTIPYMSPEQARGAKVDQRTDIWAFGCVLYEMLTGRRAFDGDTQSDVIAAVLGRVPEWSALPADTPPSVRRMLQRCLEKDLKRRLRDIGDARSDLEEALSPSTSQGTPAAMQSTSRAGTARRNVRRTAVLLTLACVVGVVAGALVLARRPAPAPVVRTIIAADTFVAGTDRNFAFTPDGSALGYVSSDARQLFVRPLDSLEPVPILTTAAFIKGLFPSPDAQWFGYIENNIVLKRISVRGGRPSTLLTMDGPSRGAAWGPDDTIVFATGAPETGLQRIPAGGGPVTVLTRPDHERGESDHVSPVWLPDGRTLLFTVLMRDDVLDRARVAALDPATGARRTVLEGGYGARYVKSGHLVYATDGALWAIRFDAKRLETQGTAREVLRPVSVGAMGGLAEFDIASNGALAYSRGAASQGNRLPVWVDRDGRETPISVPPSNYMQPRFSPDGKRLAIVVWGDLFVWDFRRPWSTASRLTFDPRIDWFPVWTPDSKRILFGSWRGGAFSNIYAYDLESGATERITDSPEMQLPTAITADGSTLVFHSFPKSLQALRLGTGAASVTLVETPREERNGVLSPDGHWLAYEGENPLRPGELNVYVRSFPDVDRGLWQVSTGGGLNPLWARSGRELFYVTLDGTMFAVPVEASRTVWKAGSPMTLFRGRYELRDGSLSRNYDVAPDGRFLMLKNRTSDEAPHIVLVQNWVAELARQD